LPVIAVGASAGGLAALETVFGGLGGHLGAAYVVIQHLSPDFKSHMTELLGRVTSLPVTQAVDRTELEPDHVYVIPPKKEMILSAGKLLLTDKDPRNAPSLPIDTFLRSMAPELGRRAVAVILSGTGSDGARGVREIKAAGGLVIVQDPEDAEFDGMPLSALGTGAVDVSLDAAQIPAELARIVPMLLRRHGEERTSPILEAGLRQVLDVLETRHDLDFSSYKTTTLARRTRRRMELCGVSSIELYAARVAADPEESRRLYHDLLIGVTEFFRDAGAYEQLADAVRETLFTEDSADLRVWVAGCATGEEAYSIAIMLDEIRRDLAWRGKIRLFATDIHADALKQASLGIYPREALRNVSEARRERYFTDSDSELRVSEGLREMVIFARHNLVSDAPFTQLDLICCRNVLIYFQPELQARVLALFHFGLRTGGLLFLGPSETLGKLHDEFEPVSTEAKIFSKRRDLRLLSHPGLTKLQLPIRHREASPAITAKERKGIEAYESLLERFMPAAFLLDDGYQLLHCFGQAERFIELRGGRMSTALPDLLSGRLKNAVSGLIERFKQDAASSHSVKLRHEGNGLSGNYRLTISAVPLPRSSRTNVLVEIRSLTEESAGEEPAPAPEPSAAAEYVESLERDLDFTRTQLQTTVEELEAANEELQAANEELVASNEELQSTNEELRSVNEELNSVNIDHQKKIAELSEVTEDLENLLHTINVGVLFLDDSMCIRRVNSRMGELLHILPQDVGRSFEHFKNNLYAPGVFDMAHSVMRDGARKELEIRAPSGQALLLTVLPYKSKNDRATGVVLTVVDITSLKAAESEAARLSAIVRSSREAIISLSLSGVITSWNAGAQKLYGWSAAEAIGRDFRFLVPDELRPEVDNLLAETRNGRDVPVFETVRVAKDGARLNVLVSVTPVRSSTGDVQAASVIAMDITDRKKAEERAAVAVRQGDRFLAMLSHELRNPLMALASANELLARRTAGDDTTKRVQAIISRQITQMSRLLEDTLDASRMRHDKIEVRRQLLDLRAVVEAAMDATRPHAAAARVALQLDLPDERVQVKADAARLQQVIVNLTHNAINHSDPGQTVKVVVRDDSAHAEVEVRDEGAGIPPESLVKVFEPFYQASRRSKTGMGLGLSLARAIAKAHDGDISAHSEGAGQGAVFTLRLPLPRAGADTNGDPLEASTAASGRTTIVLIDDDDASRENVAMLLTDAGYDVHEASTGNQGLCLIDDVTPVVAVVDVGLPDMNGLDIARVVREKYGPQIRLIALTGYGQQSDREAAIEAGCDMHLVKPIDFSTLERVIAYQASR
jgi:two-component system, chemotaxis family, CheB/CheR fusion protein